MSSIHLLPLLSPIIFFLLFPLSLQTIPPPQTQKILLDTTEVSFHFDPTSPNIFLYNNPNTPYSDIVNLTNKQNQTVSLTINDLSLVNISLPIIQNYTQYTTDTSVQGKIGLGIDWKMNNVFINHLKNQSLISNKKVYLIPKENTYSIEIINANKTNVDDTLKKKIKKMTHCKLTSRNDLQDIYKNTWACEFSHIAMEKPNSKSSNLSLSLLNDTVEINGVALFDHNLPYIYAPIEYASVLVNILSSSSSNSNSSICKSTTNASTYEAFITCSFNDLSNQANKIYFLFDGIGYFIPLEDLFERSNGNYLCKIIFSPEISNVWRFGTKFLKNFIVEFDYDNKTVGLFGDNVEGKNFEKEWKVWKNNNAKFIDKVYNDKVLMIIGVVVGGAILLAIFIIILRTFAKRNEPVLHSQMIEENNRNNV